MTLVLLFVLCLVFVRPSNSYVSLNTPTVLLPWYSNSTGSVTFELKAKPEASCLQWKARNDDVVALLKKTPEGTYYLGDTSKCSSSILLTPISSKPTRRSTIIMVKNSIDTYLRCDVIVDKIKRIEIITRTRELNVGEMFENIELAGYDNHDNVFNTMIGLSFQWSIKPSPNSSIKDINSIMKITNFDQTSYTADPRIIELETKGLRGSSIMIEPINTGEVILTASFRDPSYSTVITDSVVILVRGDIFIGETGDSFDNNNNIYALPNTLIDIKPRRFFRGKFMPITLPSNQYLVNISDHNVVGIEYGKVRTKKPGQSNVAVIDNYIPLGKHSSIPTVQFHVVNPNVIDVHLKDCNEGESCWYFRSKSVVDLHVNVFYNMNPINIEDNIVLITEIDISNKNASSLSHVHSNGSAFVIGALAKGKVELTVTLKGYINDKRVTTVFEKPLKFFKTFYVVDPIVIVPDGSASAVEEIYLAELPKPYNQPITLHLNARGGTDQFQWRLHESNPHPKVVTLSNQQPGKIVVHPVTGVYKVVISDTVASYAAGISAVLSLVVQPIDHFKFSKSQHEIYTNETLSADIDLYIKHPSTKLYHRVHVYALLPFVFKTDAPHQTLFIYKDSSRKLSNAAQLILSDHGDYHLHALLKLVDRQPLKASALVRAYNHLAVVVDGRCEGFNAFPGSDVTVVTIGGPFPVHGAESGFFAKVELVNGKSGGDSVFSQKFPLIQTGNLKTDNDKYVFTVSCSKVGANSVRITLGNSPTKSNPHPLVESVVVTAIECAHPADYDLSSVVSIVGYENISSNRHCLNTHHLRYDEDFVMELQLIHRVQNLPLCSFPKLNNAHTLLRSINTSANSKLTIKHINNEDSSISSFGHYLLSNVDKFVGPSSLEIQLHYSYNGYKANYRKEFLANFVVLPEFAFNTVHLLRHDDDAAIVPIYGGSNVFSGVVSDSSIVSVIVEPFSKFSGGKINLAHHKPGKTPTTISKVAVVKPRSKVGQTSVVLVDQCLPQPLSANSLFGFGASAKSTIDVSVDVVQHLFVNYTSKVMIGSSSLLEISLFDSKMRPISKNKFHLINFTYEISSDAFIRVETSSSLWPDSDYSRFWLVRPLAVGTTSLNVKAALASNAKAATSTVVASSTVTIETYDPLRVSPDTIYAIPHMTFQLNLRGGPAVSSDHRIEYHFDNENTHRIIDFSDQLHSIYTKNEGQVALTLKSVSVSTNQVLSQAVVKVYCAKLESVHIESSSQLILQNNTVVVKARFRNSANQFTTFGILPPALAIHWDVPHPNEIVSSYWLSGFDSVDDGSECINLQLNELGRFSLQLKVFVSPDYLNYVGGPKLSLHQSKSHSIHYLFARHDFETVPRLSIEPSKSLQVGWFNWKNHDQSMISSLALLADYSSLEYMIPVDGATYVINSNFNNLWAGSESPSSASNHPNTNIDSIVHWTIINSSPSNLIQISCHGSSHVIDRQQIEEGTDRYLSSVQCSSGNLLIKSSHFKGTAVIVATRRFQSRPVMVKVKSVNQISLVFVSELKAAKVVVENRRWFAFPVGYTAMFKLVAMDEHGGIFSTVQAKSYLAECVNCKNVLLRNTLDADGSLSITMKYPGNVAIKVSHMDEPHISFVLRFIIIHGLDPSHSPPQSFVGRYEIGENSHHRQQPTLTMPNEANSNEPADVDHQDDDIDDSATVVHEITIQRAVGSIFLLSPVFTIEDHQLEWLVSDENNLKLLWKNLTHAVLYSVKLGESKLTVISSTSRQPHGYAVMSNILPDGIAFQLKSTSDSSSNPFRNMVVISNYENFEKCLPIHVLSSVFRSNTTADQFVAGSLLAESTDRIDHPFVCNLLFNPGSNDDGFDNPFRGYIEQNYVTTLKIDVPRLAVMCCVKFVGKHSFGSGDFSSSQGEYGQTSNSTTSHELVVEAHLKGHPKITTRQLVDFVSRFQLLTKTVLSSSGEISYLADSLENHDRTTSNKLSVMVVPKDGSIATIQLVGDPTSFKFIKVTSSHTNCFKTQVAPDYYSNRSALIRVGFTNCQTLNKDDSLWLQAESSLTGQTTRIQIVLSDGHSFTLSHKRTTWFYLRAAFDSLPRAISVDITTVFFTLLSLVGTIVVIFLLSGGDSRISGLANDLRRAAHNATGLVPQAFQSFYRKPAPQPLPPNVGAKRRVNGVAANYNNLMHSSYGTNSNSASSKTSSKTTIKSTGARTSKPAAYAAIYDDDFGKIPHSKPNLKTYNASQ